MRRLLTLLVVVLEGTGALAACRGARARPPRSDVLSSPLRTTYAEGIDSLELALRGLTALPDRPDPVTAQRAFRRARAAYKRIEYLVEFEDALRVAALNGPSFPIPDEDDLTSVIEPTGFQVIEGVVFPHPGPNFANVVHRQVEYMRRVLQYIRADWSESSDPPRRPFDAARMELARVATLGLAGFDAALSKDGLLESAEALRGVDEGLTVSERYFRPHDPDAWDALHRAFEAAIADLEAAPDFDRFDRLAFLVRFANPIADQLDRVQRSVSLPPPTDRSPWSPGATNIYASGAIDPRWFAPDYAPPPSPQLVALGRQLFFDPALSGHGRRSCATCHEPARAFTDGRALAAVDPGHGRVRNTPTLLNAGLQLTQFADQRVRFLEFQFEAVMSNPREMASPADSAALRLRADPALATQFAAVFGKPRPEALTGQTLSIAVAAYVRSLEAMDSRFDRAIRGDTAAITPSERRGFNLFMGKAGCGSCHFAPLFGGTMPPKFLESEPEVIGVPARAGGKRAMVDPDPGVFAIDHAPLHRHAFKTPTVRNVALTAPYMHNGVFRTLKAVVDFYDRGGGNGLGQKLPNQTLPSARLHLSAQEKDDLVAFLGALTDSTSAAR
jgi:cytochrome c peroxidase